MASVKKAGIEFYAKIDTNRDLIGAESQFSAEVIVDADGSILSDGSNGTNGTVSIGAFSEVGSTGIYRAPITLPDEGDYTVSVKWTDGTDTEYIPFPVEIKSADMSDIKDLIDALQADMKDVKDQVDVLDEAELNGIAEQVQSVDEAVNNIKALVAEYVGSFEISGDETGLLTVGSTVSGDTSGATGEITAVVYDAGTDITGVTVDSQEGVFVTGETVSVGRSSSTGTITTVSNNPVNSVMEFVEAINSALTEGGSSLDVLASYTDNLELMLEGKEYVDTEGNTVSAEDSKGLAEIYAAIEANGVDIADNNTAIANLSTDVANLKTSVEGKVDAVQSTLDGMLDETDSDSLVSKLNAVKTAVEANQTTLEDAGYGLEALKNLIDTVDTNLDGLIADFADGGRLEVRFDTIDTTLDNLSTAINDQTTHLDSRFDDVDAALAAISSTQQYKGFV
jgi:peptidoglycan hydrolase CwlO-like protein